MHGSIYLRGSVDSSSITGGYGIRRGKIRTANVFLMLLEALPAEVLDLETCTFLQGSISGHQYTSVNPFTTSVNPSLQHGCKISGNCFDDFVVILYFRQFHHQEIGVLRFRFVLFSKVIFDSPYPDFCWSNVRKCQRIEPWQGPLGLRMILFVFFFLLLNT
jgi:hypothetical protein